MDSSAACVKFTGKNYSPWAFQFELFLKGKELWGHIDRTDVAPTSDSDKSKDVVSSPSWVVLDARIMSWLLGSVEPHLITNLQAYRSAQSMWNYLKKNLHKTSQSDQFLMKLRPEYESVCSSLLNRSPVPSLDICIGELLREERLSTQAILEQSHGSSKTTTMVYAAQGRGLPMTSKNLQCFCCREYGHIAANCPKKYCSYCKKKGHIIKECRSLTLRISPKHFRTYLFLQKQLRAHDSSSGCFLRSCTSCGNLRTPPRNGATDANFSIICDGVSSSLPIPPVRNASSTFTDVFLAPQLSTNLISVGPGNREADREGT
ncbi:hypothetical protein Patl1_07356 [Pistacia atlantica]|uniref:Uncharacterized protein n=1 Tax=Pistacia atlantica TaxID=434234 RepID=A0ACC1AHQ3_9ROSI|nr:hypothetical protein Patl1_07356 [Pistacia atlantica]